MLWGLLNALYLWSEIPIPVRENESGSFQVRMLEKQASNIEIWIRPTSLPLPTCMCFLMALLMIVEIGVEKGFCKALTNVIIMQLQLALVFFNFSLGIKTHYYGRTFLHWGAEYRGTGCGFVVFHARFAENYRLYSRNHFVKGME